MVDIYVHDQYLDDIELAVFDKDGTIIDLYTYWSNMVALRAQALCEQYTLDVAVHKEGLMYAMGVDVQRKKLRPKGPVGILPRAIVQKAAEDYLATVGFSNTAVVCMELFKKVDGESLEYFHTFVQPIPGALDVLRKLKDAGCMIAIATTDKKERALLAMQHLDSHNLFDVIVGNDEVNHPKPHPEMLELICRLLQASPEKSIMVGDALTDVQMGVNAHFGASVGVCSGLTDRSTLRSVTPYIMTDVSEMHIVKNQN